MCSSGIEHNLCFYPLPSSLLSFRVNKGWEQASTFLSLSKTLSPTLEVALTGSEGSYMQPFFARGWMSVTGVKVLNDEKGKINGL